MATLDTMLMAGKEAPSEERPPTLYELALFGHLCGQAALEESAGLRPNPETATVPNMAHAWPHPMRSTEHDAAEAIATACGWPELWLWE